MKILFVSSDPQLLRAESEVYSRHLQYAALFGELHIVIRSEKTMKLVNGPLTIHAFRCGRFIAPLLLALKTRNLVHEIGIEIVSAQDPFEHGWAAAHAVRNTSARLHIQVHTDFLTRWFTHGDLFHAPAVPAPLLNRVRRLLADHVLLQAHGIRVVSERVRDSLIREYGVHIPEPVVIPISVSLESYPVISLPDHTFTFALISVSRLEPEKRIEDILVAVAKISREYPSVGLFIVGEGRERSRLVSLTQSLQIQDRVHFLGAKSVAEVSGLMQSAQAFIQASAYEGYGMTLLEAALARIPIITTDVGIVGEVFKGYEDVLAVPVGDPAALATHIAGLVEDAQARRGLVINAERKAREHVKFAHETANSIAEHLRSLLV